MKAFKISAKLGPDGKLTAEGLQEAMKVMIDALDLSPGERRDLERELAEQLAEAPLVTLSVRSMIRCLERVEKLLEDMPDGVVALAQAVDSPPQIFQLGAVMELMSAAQRMAGEARTHLQHIIKCQKHFAAKPKSDETLS
jgi:hypothetical protein